MVIFLALLLLARPVGGGEADARFEFRKVRKNLYEYLLQITFVFYRVDRLELPLSF